MYPHTKHLASEVIVAIGLAAVSRLSGRLDLKTNFRKASDAVRRTCKSTMSRFWQLLERGLITSTVSGQLAVPLQLARRLPPRLQFGIQLDVIDEGRLRRGATQISAQGSAPTRVNSPGICCSTSAESTYI